MAVSSEGEENGEVVDTREKIVVCGPIAPLLSRLWCIYTNAFMC